MAVAWAMMFGLSRKDAEAMIFALKLPTKRHIRILDNTVSKSRQNGRKVNYKKHK